MTAKRNKSSKHKVAKLVPVTDARVGTENVTEDDIKTLARIADGIYSGSDFHDLAQVSNTHILPKVRPGKELSAKEQSMLAIKLINRYGLDTLWQLRESVSEADMVVQTAQELVRDYECRTASEKAMAQVAANAFGRILENSRIMRGYGALERVDQLQINFYTMVGKELDRATRQFDTAISNLMRMKTPTLKVNVTAKTAFVANNQQINANQK